MSKFRQCRLKNNNIETTSFIPEEHAQVNNILALKNNGEWESGWVVLSVGELIEEKLINKAHDAGKIWKPSTDITSRGNK